MAEDHAALVENIYDLTFEACHLDSLVSRAEGRLLLIADLPRHTAAEILALTNRLDSTINRLRVAIYNHPSFPEE
jgi:hypothetical protein